MPPKAAPGELGRGRRGARGGGRGGGRGASPGHGGPPIPGGPPQRGEHLTQAIPTTGGPAVQHSLIPATRVSAIGVRRPGQGTAGLPVEVFTNNFAIELNPETIHHYDGMYLSFSLKGFTEKCSPSAPPRCSR